MLEVRLVYEASRNHGKTLESLALQDPLHGEDVDTLMKSADVALYEAKRAGKNSYCVSSDASANATECATRSPGPHGRTPTASSRRLS